MAKIIYIIAKAICSISFITLIIGYLMIKTPNYSYYSYQTGENLALYSIPVALVSGLIWFIAKVIVGQRG